MIKNEWVEIWRRYQVMRLWGVLDRDDLVGVRKGSGLTETSVGEIRVSREEERGSNQRILICW